MSPSQDHTFTPRANLETQPTCQACFWTEVEKSHTCKTTQKCLSWDFNQDLLAIRGELCSPPSAFLTTNPMDNISFHTKDRDSRPFLTRQNFCGWMTQKWDKWRFCPIQLSLEDVCLFGCLIIGYLLDLCGETLRS